MLTELSYFWLVSWAVSATMATTTVVATGTAVIAAMSMPALPTVLSTYHIVLL